MTVEQFRVVLDKVSADSTVVDFTKGLNNASVYIYNDNKGMHFAYFMCRKVNFIVTSQSRLCIPICEHAVCAVGGVSCAYLHPNDKVPHWLCANNSCDPEYKKYQCNRY